LGADARVRELLRMLLDTEARSARQRKFEAALSAEPPAKKRRKGSAQGKGKNKWSCSDCLDENLSRSKVVVCPQYDVGYGCKCCDCMSMVNEHVLCCGCMRTYILGCRLHGGDLSKLMCQRCVTNASEDTGLQAYAYDNSGDEVA